MKVKSESGSDLAWRRLAREGCPDTSDLVRHGEGEAILAVARHLKTCALCREDIAFMRSNEAAWILPSPATDGPALPSALATAVARRARETRIVRFPLTVLDPVRYVPARLSKGLDRECLVVNLRSGSAKKIPARPVPAVVGTLAVAVRDRNGTLVAGKTGVLTGPHPESKERGRTAQKGISSRRVRADRHGVFRIESLKPGRYLLTVGRERIEIEVLARPETLLP